MSKQQANEIALVLAPLQILVSYIVLGGGLEALLEMIYLYRDRYDY